MSGKKKFLAFLLVVLVFASVLAGIFWHMQHYQMVDFRFYEKGTTFLDLRGEKISLRHYQKLTRRMPDCEILWDVPLSSGSFACDSRKIAISGLTDEDVVHMDYLTELEAVDAEGCRDYFQLLDLRERRPELDVRYSVDLGGETYAQSVIRVDLKNLREEEIPLLQSLPKLKTVIISSSDRETAEKLQEYCHSNGLNFGLNLGGTPVLDTQRKTSIPDLTEETAALLPLLTALEELTLEETDLPAETLLQLREDMAGTDIFWQREVCGVLCSTKDAELDLSEESIRSLQRLERDMAYFPDVETVFLGEQDLDNEDLAEFRDQVREQYKVVWVVECGKKLKARTDDTTFMPTRERVYYFNDEEAYNLRYCEDMVCMDIGHMSITNIDFVEFMPDLEYLVLAHTQLQYIEPIRHCKKLKFLELDWSPIKDFTPLLECTALEDLNLGNTFADFEPIGKMTWLKNLWMIGCSSGARYRMTQELTDTKVMISGDATVANGWRNLDNYYEMRDLLGMHYMSW